MHRLGREAGPHVRASRVRRRRGAGTCTSGATCVRGDPTRPRDAGLAPGRNSPPAPAPANVCFSPPSPRMAASGRGDAPGQAWGGPVRPRALSPMGTPAAAAGGVLRAIRCLPHPQVRPYLCRRSIAVAGWSAGGRRRPRRAAVGGRQVVWAARDTKCRCSLRGWVGGPRGGRPHAARGVGARPKATARGHTTGLHHTSEPTTGTGRACDGGEAGGCRTLACRNPSQPSAAVLKPTTGRQFIPRQLCAGERGQAARRSDSAA